MNQEKQGAMTEEEKRAIFRERARKLARPVDKAGSDNDLEVVEFLLSGERYGLEAGHIREVYPFGDITHVPCTPPFVLGVINVRGQILSVIDIRKFFDMPETGVAHNKVIILHSDVMEFGIIADEISGIRRVKTEDLQPSLPTLTGLRADYMKGVTGDRMIVLSAERLLSDARMIVNEEVTA
ncbi:MAG: chemotaxis protein CheW [Deltaproteobacteria bacterium]